MGVMRFDRHSLVGATPSLLLACSQPVADAGGSSDGSSAAATSGTTAVPDGTTTSSTSTGIDDADATTPTTVEPDTSSGSATDDGPTPPLLDVGNDTPVEGCDSDVGDFIFLLDIDGGLHRLSPGTLDVESLGQPVCDGASSAMALTVDRNGLLWSMMVDDQGNRGIYTIDPTTLDCVATAFVDPIAENIGVNSLAFVADEPGGETESLYVGANVGGSFDFDIPLSLGRVDLATMDMEIVGTSELVPTGYYQIADLTGTGDSRVFGFFAGDVAAIAELDDADASLVGYDVLDFGVGSPWAFAQWAGRLWLFSSGGAPGSDIRAWDPATGDVEEIHPGIGVAVVGAAVSTCAPYQPEG
jgi:hypothetical protein